MDVDAQPFFLAVSQVRGKIAAFKDKPVSLPCRVCGKQAVLSRQLHIRFFPGVEVQVGVSENRHIQLQKL
ncbi:hypothetical protein ACWGPW_10695 [Paenibacillus chitinolyticus]